MIQFSTGEGRNPDLTGLTPPYLCACPKAGPGFPSSYVVVFFFVFRALKEKYEDTKLIIRCHKSKIPKG
jgi:hypothetical protein